MPPLGVSSPAPDTRGCRLRLVAVVMLAALGPLGAETEAGGELGLPFTRFYSYAEIGNTSSGMRLGFDSLGRIALTRAGSCIVLNDTTWLDLAEREGTGIVMQRLVFGSHGETYYGAFGSWGVVWMHAGRLRPESRVPTDAPKWTRDPGAHADLPDRRPDPRHVV